MDKDVVIVANYELSSEVSLEEICEICHIPAEVVYHFVEYEVLHPVNTNAPHLMFNLQELERLKIAIRLHRDLDINFAGLSILLDLLDEINELKRERNFLKQYHGS